MVYYATRGTRLGSNYASCSLKNQVWRYCGVWNTLSDTLRPLSCHRNLGSRSLHLCALSPRPSSTSGNLPHLQLHRSLPNSFCMLIAYNRDELRRCDFATIRPRTIRTTHRTSLLKPSQGPPRSKFPDSKSLNYRLPAPASTKNKLVSLRKVGLLHLFPEATKMRPQKATMRDL